jgi:hypothetical protein
VNFIWVILYTTIVDNKVEIGVVNMSGPRVPSWSDITRYLPGYVTGYLLECRPEESVSSENE